MTESERVLRRELRETRRHLRELTATVTVVLGKLDAVMSGPSTPERGRVIAGLANKLNLANDSAKMFGLPKRRQR